MDAKQKVNDFPRAKNILSLKFQMLLSIFWLKHALDVAQCSPPVQMMESAPKDDVSTDEQIDDVAAVPAATLDPDAKAPMFDKEELFPSAQEQTWQ